MSFYREAVKERLKSFDFKRLFREELGWDNFNSNCELKIEDCAYKISGVSEKRGVAVFVCGPNAEGRIPDSNTRRRIEREITKIHHEHLIIFVDAAQDEQIWQWVYKDNRPFRYHEHHYTKNQGGESLAQKLERIEFDLFEEEDLTTVEVARRLKPAFNVEKVTKKFYDLFSKEHATFLQFLDGIPDAKMQRWYVSVMLNRLMFIYFIQKKGFLNNDTDYLRAKLTEMQEKGSDLYYEKFLCPLFFEGFAKPESERSEKMNRLLGKIPYLNGGIFQQHQIEHLHGKTISIPDKAFEKLFEFFEQYQWHLDDRPNKDDNEINPDVLGYIFEKYINQKEMGAYYTKEDITEYISKSTIIPFMFDAALKKIPKEKHSSIWSMLKENPDKYIYRAVRKGVDKPLPPHIAVGLNDVSKRIDWNKPADEEFALPTEIWREVVARRKRYDEVSGKLKAGEITSINDFITYNLDIRQFARDVIDKCDDPDVLRAFWHAIEEVSVLDPTCGSGAFLFAALNILEDLYEACIDRMQGFVDDLKLEQKPHPEKYKDFKNVLEKLSSHASRKYFVFKSIIINNLYGVDIMEEAVEICKLRLFLKLVAQVESVDKIEPLPDIDFNIRAGNTLVGFASLEEVKKTQEGTLGFGTAEVSRIEEAAQDVDKLFVLFRQQQTELGGMVTAADKKNLQARLKKLTDELDRFLAGEYGVDTKKKDAFDKWHESHQPFHWFAEFYGILNTGGFDVIIGNPPYVEKKSVEVKYSIRCYETESTNNLFAYVTERSVCLMTPSGRFGFILLLSAMSTEKFEPLQLLVMDQELAWISHFDDRPSRLFENLEHCQQTILLFRMRETGNGRKVYVTRCHKWNSLERANLFTMLEYVEAKPGYIKGSVQKIGSSAEARILEKLWCVSIPLSATVTERGRFPVFYTRKVHAFLNILDFVPRILDGKGRRRDPSEQKTVEFGEKEIAKGALCLLNSTLFRWYLTTYSDCRNVNRREVMLFPVDLRRLMKNHGSKLSKLGSKLSEKLQHTSEVREMRFGGETLSVQCIIPKHSKPIIDEIDRVLAAHYGFTDEELDFIINYDIKYRMGKATEVAEE